MTRAFPRAHRATCLTRLTLVLALGACETERAPTTDPSPAPPAVAPTRVSVDRPAPLPPAYDPRAI